jgi:hypothetical protein
MTKEIRENMDRYLKEIREMIYEHNESINRDGNY